MVTFAIDMEKVAVVIPAYKTELSVTDRISLQAVARNLGSYPVILVVPKDIDVANIKEILPNAEIESFNNDYFAGIAGYNRLMMSEEFYSRFSNYGYILVYQLDAYVFSDQLREWCDKGYDYIGAPWLVRPIYKYFPLNVGSRIKHGLRKFLGKPDLTVTNWAVGNGGFSLRRVESHLRAVKQLSDVVDRYLKVRHHIFNEDVFFSVEVKRAGLGFKYPSWKEALKFAFDKYPKLCYKLNGYELPFGCHAWTKRKMRKFWMPIILKNQ